MWLDMVHMRLAFAAHEDTALLAGEEIPNEDAEACRLPPSCIVPSLRRLIGSAISRRRLRITPSVAKLRSQRGDERWQGLQLCQNLLDVDPADAPLFHATSSANTAKPATMIASMIATVTGQRLKPAGNPSLRSWRSGGGVGGWSRN